ncbi:excinuclease ABC subunit B [Candidatus Falkowbacteria bacterium CG10_big_fil_rev_8_21_14_0_10_39_11]|uniref:UvrABC system protein B n=1 Tax=Candidatus Falkowbacteria bacterium CG10_big_fil_rev_8_21_14_0_10_39_11 TaxID=1974565 RepID=A0A2H0V3I9_9BACT|nr:MAG: excinuclease ABC subunit B [Candidatus Falkowbacteria bacterium CG10_big_fil_rev_8_21_14_0_10_39_11]
MEFKLKAKYKPAGDQPEAIKKLTAGINKGFDKQTLLGVTGSGKTFTIANVIEQVQKPTLVIAHNKTLAAQLCNEFREFFPDNAVEYFVSYYDYYQPEAYLPSSDTYIEKEAQINEEIDRLRHACTQALLTRNDVIIVASVSAIYGLGAPDQYEKVMIHFEQGEELNRRELMEHLIDMQYTRTNAELRRGMFRMTGQVFEVMPVNEEMIYRFEISEKIDRMEKVEPVTRKIVGEIKDAWLFPAKHYVLNEQAKEAGIVSIKQELKKQLAKFEKEKKLLEYERLKQKTRYDLEMIQNVGYCNGIENYSRHFDGRVAGEPPFTLLDYFKHGAKEFLTVIDESHVTVPQIRAMYNGDQARKNSLIDHGFRLPSARDNRPLKYDEFDRKTDQVIYTSATPSDYELKESKQITEQIVRPTGLVDPAVTIKPVTEKKEIEITERLRELSSARENKKTENREEKTKSRKQGNKSQIDDLIAEIENQVKKKERTLVTTLTKRMAEDITDFLKAKGIKVEYLHSDIDTLQRIDIITKLRKGEVDVLVGVNLLREGLDIPEVSLVAILDADKEGFLRSETSLIQTIGRAARNANGRVILYADVITGSIKNALRETDRRREKQWAYNEKHGITPQTIEKSIRNILEEFGLTVNKKTKKQGAKSRIEKTLQLELASDTRPLKKIIAEKEKAMKLAAKNLEFELASILRDEVATLKKQDKK